MVGTPYMVAKAGAAHLVRQAALELARYGIRVNAIAPGPFLTRITSPGLHAIWDKALPVGRVATTDEIKGLALFLLPGIRLRHGRAVRHRRRLAAGPGGLRRCTACSQ